MASTAIVTLFGNLGRDPESRYTPNGRMNVQFTMAVSRRKPDGSENTNWFRVTAWGRLAETLDRLATNGALVKGKQVFVLGTFEARDYQDQEGKPRYSLDVAASEVYLAGPTPQADTAPESTEGVPF